MPAPVFLAGETLAAAKLQELGRSGTYTPALTAATTNPTLGTGAVASGWYHVNGACIDVWFQLQFGSSGAAAGSGLYHISGPPGIALLSGFPDMALGTARVIDSSASSERVCSVIGAGNSSGTIRVNLVVASANTLVTDANPWTWAASDLIMGHFTYPTT